jgi:hypothetical protein
VSGDLSTADASGRRAAIVIIVAGVVAGVLLLAVAGRFRPQFEQWVQRDPRPRATLVITVAAVATVGPLLAAAAYLWTLAHRVDRSGQYPPPGWQSLRDIGVQTGAVAIRRARQVRLLASVLALAAAILTVVLWMLVALLRQALRS